MDATELMRSAQQEDERRRRLGIHPDFFEDIKRNRELLSGFGAMRLLQQDQLKDLATQILAPGVMSAMAEASRAALKSPIFKSIQETNLSSLRLMDGFTNHSSAIAEMTRAATRNADWMDFKGLYAPKLSDHLFLESHFSQIAQISALAQSALAVMDFSQIGAGFSVTEEIRASFAGKFEGFTNSYANLFRSFEVPETSLFTLPPGISELPTIEYFNSADLLESTVPKFDPDEYEEERVLVRTGIRESTYDSIIIQLSEVNQGWVDMLAGAREAFRSTNPDKTRHCITSLRELVREIMQHFSPDKHIETWSTSETDFHNKRPTRRARLQYISRNINHGPFTEFVEKDIAAILAAIDLFQAGTHAANSKLTEAQVAALIARVESTILFLFSIATYQE
jgi:hypothetical protein